MSKPDRAAVGERGPMSDDYDHGRREGLRLALAILAAEEARWAALLGESGSRRTNLSRSVRHKALQIAQKRIGTALNRLAQDAKGEADAELISALEKAGL